MAKKYVILSFLLISQTLNLVTVQESLIPEKRDDALFYANMLIPGILQLSYGQEEGWQYLSGGALGITGQIMTISYGFGNKTPDEQWERGLGNLLSEIGFSQWMYSFYADSRDRLDLFGSPETRARIGRESFGTLLAAPFIPKNTFSLDILPVVGLAIANSLRAEDFLAMRDYWS